MRKRCNTGLYAPAGPGNYPGIFGSTGGLKIPNAYVKKKDIPIQERLESDVRPRRNEQVRKDKSISLTEIDTRHGITDLEARGLSRENIMKTMYKKTDGMSQQDRTKLVERLFDRTQR